MYVLEPLKHLIAHDHDRFEVELAVAAAKDILKGLPQQVHHHKIVLPFSCAHVVMGYATIHYLVVV